jgi:formate dehydrogenase maturation protein FdhE
MAKDKLKQTDIDQYVRCGGEYCPFCGSTEVYQVSVMFYDDEKAKIYKEITCMTCDRDWTDVFDLASIVPVMPVIN